nr:DNA recombination protein RmuC [uncultured Prevotella sp.]
MEIIIGIIVGLIIGFVVGKLLTAKSAGEEKAQLLANYQVKVSENEQLQKQIEQVQLQVESEKQALKDNQEIILMNERSHHAVEMQTAKEHYAGEMQTIKEHHADEMQNLKEQMASERQYAAQMRQENDRQWAEKMEALRQEMQRMTAEQQKAAAEQLAAKQSALQENNRLQMDELLKPIKEQFADFKKSVEDSKTQNEVSKKELQSTFEATMKLFQQEQQQAVSSLKEQTSKIGSDAANLTKALKGDSKLQGDWGEMVLETILENSGLRKDEEFFIQENTKDENGKNFRPDVIVRFPEGRSVVIDSKVSLTAYTDALAADNDADRDRLMKAHALSVRKHIDELAEKDYSKLVDDAIGFVLMFIPNETSYIAAMKQQPELSRYAYQKKIIIISPSNLLMALQLAYNLWQYDRQNKNVEKIVKTAADLYDKVAGFEDTFTSIGDVLSRLSTTYDKAKKQLYEGSGNVMRRVESLKSLGVTPKKQIKSLEE